MLLRLCLLLCLLTACQSFEYYDDCVGAPSNDKSAASLDFCTSNECVKAAGSILSAMDLTADPCNDFYKYACGGFELHQNIPAGESSFTPFHAIDKTLKKQLLSLIQTPVLKDEPLSRQKVGRYFNTCIEIETVLRSSIPKMQQMVEKMGGLLLKCNEAVAKNWSLNQALAIYETFSDSALFGMSVSFDERNVTQHAIILDQGPLILGPFSRDFYLNKNVTSDAVLVAETNALEKIARLVLGEKAAINRSLIIDVIQFDKKRAEIQQTQTELQDRLATYNSVNISFLQANYGFFNWEKYFQDVFSTANASFSRDDPIVLFGLPYFRDLSTLMNEYFLKPGGRKILQNYMIFRSLISYAPVLGGQFQAIIDEFFAVFAGKQGSQQRWEICMDDVDAAIGFPLGAMFVEKYFPQKDKDRATGVILNTLKMFRKRIEKVTWMDEETRSRALEKVDTLVCKVAYPDWLLNDTYLDCRYSKLQVGDDFVTNKFAAVNYHKLRQLHKIREAPDRTDWQMNPQTINAYYDPTVNTFVIPAGILSSPFFYAADGMPSVLNFGAVGAIAGHEITHGFDNMGRQYDKLGNLNDWWKKESAQQFKDRSKCYIDKYNAYEVDGIQVKGDQTLPENLADDGAIHVALAAYRDLAICEGFKKLVGLDGLTPEQLFFVSWSQSWCAIQTPANRRLLLQTDPHSPDRFRVMGPLSNSEDFALAFNCSLGSPMNPGKKCSLW